MKTMFIAAVIEFMIPSIGDVSLRVPDLQSDAAAELLAEKPLQELQLQ